MRELHPLRRTMKTKKTYIGRGALGSRGFSLIELMIVCAILGALAIAVRIYINNDDAKLRSFVFNLGTRFKQAKYEAIKSGRDVFLDLDYDGNGVVGSYALWIDSTTFPVPPAAPGLGTLQKWDGTKDTNGNGVCDENEGDCLIGQVGSDPTTAIFALDPLIEVYDATNAAITGGPASASGSGGGTIGTGLNTATANRWFRFHPDGTCEAGSLYLYLPRSVGANKKVSAGPLAIVVNTTGRITVDEWQGGTKWKKDNT